ncbi:MAG TPA: circularly permuted type 2 ATP-grasp protein, partial [Propionibacteriaceae bacterium]|nr:circularly permuted type 2 ATP-grasp protein [Propionibacteriaceae bacterium]
IPAAAVLDHDEYLRTVVGMDSVASQRLFMIAADLGRDASGQWKVISDRTQAPSGAGFAMQNRRVISRVLPDIYQQAHLYRLTPFFQAMRLALVDAAPSTVEDPRVVVLSPGTHSETAFDQAFVASLLGFPLLEGRDLTVRDGRVWMRVLGKLEQVDVILRRVDSTWMDALELRPGSRLGVTGLLECVRQGTVSVVNNLGSGVLENPALLPYLPELCERLLGQQLRLPSVDTWWCGDPAGLGYVLDHLDSIVVRPISRGHGRSVRGAALTEEQRQQLKAKIMAAPHRFVGQEVLQLSSAPTSDQDRLVRRSLVLRSFAVRSGDSYTAMLGGLARVVDENGRERGPLVTDPDGGLAKDVWVVGRDPVVAARIVAPRDRPAEELVHASPSSATSAMVPRVLSDLFWFGRYAERTEDLVRLILATRTVAVETNFDTAPGRALEALLQAVTHVSTTYPGFLKSGIAIMPEFRSMLLDRHRAGTAAQALGSLSLAAQGVRDQLSEDVWVVLADIERALAALAANPHDQGLQLTEASEQMVTGLLALCGIASENMVRDPGWYMLDSGRGLERAIQVTSLLKVTMCQQRSVDAERLVTEAVLAATESIVTFRRRYRGRTGVEAVVDLLVLDAFNPRSVAYQLQRIRTDLRAIPNTSPTARPLRLLDGLVERVRIADPVGLAEVSDGGRPALDSFIGGLQQQLRALAEAIRDHYQQPPPTQQPLFRPQAAVRR